MNKFLFGYLVGLFQSLWMRPVDSKRDYIPSFNGYWNEHQNKLIWVEPIYRKRYVNIIEEKGCYTIQLSWTKSPTAIDSIICMDQKEAETAMQLLKVYYSEFGKTVFQFEENIYFINIKKEKRVISLLVSVSNNNEADEVITCFGLEELNELLMKIKNHFLKYDCKVKVIDCPLSKGSMDG